MSSLRVRTPGSLNASSIGSAGRRWCERVGPDRPGARSRGSEGLDGHELGAGWSRMWSARAGGRPPGKGAAPDEADDSIRDLAVGALRFSTRTGTAAGSMVAGWKSLARGGPSGRRPASISSGRAGPRRLVGPPRVLAHVVGGRGLVA